MGQLGTRGRLGGYNISGLDLFERQETFIIGADHLGSALDVNTISKAR